MSKSQITIFIVLGIVVLIIFGLMFFVSRQTSDVVLEKRVNKIYDDFLSSTDIQHITQNCLDQTAKEALFLLGLQGGRIYDYQFDGGYSIPAFYDVIPYNYTGRNISGEVYNISYGITDVHLQRVGAPPINPPDYPYGGSLVNDISLAGLSSNFLINPNNQIFANVSRSGRFTILADLCNKFGPNDPYIAGAGISCETYSPKNESIQEYITKYIDQNTPSCINFTFKRTTQYNITSGILFSDVLIGEDDLLISLVYPIEISIKNLPPVTNYLNFNIRPKIRLKIIHELASHLIGYNPYVIPTRTEANNIFFNIERDDPNDCYDGGSKCIVDEINVFKLKNYCLENDCNFNNSHYNYSDILVIEDNKSIIGGKPYRFLFAIENRKPVLDFIDESVSYDKYYYNYIYDVYERNLTQIYSRVTGYPSSNEYNLIIHSPRSFEIFPLGIDPDEDNLTYTYEVISSSLGWTTSMFHTSFYYTNLISPRHPVSGIISDHPLQKDANIVIGGTTTGDNIVRISVHDDEGLYDYQDVIIRVV